MEEAEDDAQLVTMALRGEPDARRRLAARLLDAIHREVALAVLRWRGVGGRDHRQEVNDLVQEVVVVLFERDAKELRRWDPARGRSLESFVRLVARRRAARLLGRRVRDPIVEPTDALDAQSETSDASMVERLEQRDELGVVLRMLYAQMTPRDMELFELLFVQGLEPAQVGERLDLSRGAVNAWSYRVRKQARTLAREQGMGDEMSSKRSSATMKEVRDDG